MKAQLYAEQGNTGGWIGNLVKGQWSVNAKTEAVLTEHI